MVSLIVAGATGAIGRTVVQHAAKRQGITKIIALTRSKHTEKENYPSLFGIHTAEASAVMTAKEEQTASKDASKSSSSSSRTDLPRNESILSREEVAKIHPVTFDWDAFLESWQEMKKTYRVIDPMEATGGHGSPEERIAAASEKQRKDLIQSWKTIFGGHTYSAMCLGTTRSDAGGADSFIRCDYDYVIAFAEAVLHFSGPVGFAFDAWAQAPQGVVRKGDVVANNQSFLYQIGDKTNPVKPSTGDHCFAAVSDRLCLTVDATHSSKTLRRLVQVSAANASKDAFLLYPRTKGAADAAVAERVVVLNYLLTHPHPMMSAVPATGKVENRETASGNPPSPPFMELFFLMPGLLDRYGKTRGVEWLGKWLLSSLGVEKCGACAVANLVYDGRHRGMGVSGTEREGEDCYLVALPGKKAKRNAAAFHVGGYHASVADDQQRKEHGNRLLYRWQGNAGIKEQAGRLTADEARSHLP